MSGTDIGYHAGNLATDVEYCAGSERVYDGSGFRY